MVRDLICVHALIVVVIQIGRDKVRLLREERSELVKVRVERNCVFLPLAACC